MTGGGGSLLTLLTSVICLVRITVRAGKTRENEAKQNFHGDLRVPTFSSLDDDNEVHKICILLPTQDRSTEISNPARALVCKMRVRNG